jgi:hypothetical protein
MLWISTQRLEAVSEIPVVSQFEFFAQMHQGVQKQTETLPVYLMAWPSNVTKFQVKLTHYRVVSSLDPYPALPYTAGPYSNMSGGEHVRIDR